VKLEMSLQNEVIRENIISYSEHVVHIYLYIKVQRKSSGVPFDKNRFPFERVISESFLVKREYKFNYLPYGIDRVGDIMLSVLNPIVVQIFGLIPNKGNLKLGISCFTRKSAKNRWFSISILEQRHVYQSKNVLCFEFSCLLFS
jgi:hypothetical protein